MIKHFRCKKTEKVFNDVSVRQFNSFERIARRKLEMLDAAKELEDLRLPPGNHLEALRGKLEGKYSIRINSQWRVCFTWKENNAYDVEIVDYH